MRSRTAKWFECAIAYAKTNEQGLAKKTVEKIALDALSFTEAEAAAIEEMTPFVSGEMEVKAISIAPYKEVFFTDSETADKWYKVKVEFITIDEKTAKEKRSAVTYLVQGSSSENAFDNTNEMFRSSMSDYEIKGVTETKILDVYEHIAKKEEKEDGEE